MMRKLVECSFSSMSRLSTFKPVIRPSRCSMMLAHRPILQQFTRNYSTTWLLCSRLHNHSINSSDQIHSKRGVDSRQPSPSISVSTLRYYSSLHEQCKKDSEEDTLYKWIELRCKGHDDAVLESYQIFVSMAAQELGIQIDSILKPKKTIQRLTLLKSRFIFKKHRVQYEMRTHFRVITLKHVTGSTADVLLEYIERNLPEGVAMQVKKCHLEKLPEHLTAPTDEGNDDDIMAASATSSDVGDQSSMKSSSSSTTGDVGDQAPLKSSSTTSTDRQDSDTSSSSESGYSSSSESDSDSVKPTKP